MCEAALNLTLRDWGQRKVVRATEAMHQGEMAFGTHWEPEGGKSHTRGTQLAPEMWSRKAKGSHTSLSAISVCGHLPMVKVTAKSVLNRVHM